MRKYFLGCLLAVSLLGGVCAVAGHSPAAQRPRDQDTERTSKAAEKKGGYRRWAIIASEAVEDGGLSDLLTAELSKRTDLEWVERQEFQAIIAEQQLAACFGARAVAERTKLGKLVGADVLVLLSLEAREAVSLEAGERGRGEGGEKETFLKLMISDCGCGARLRLEFLPYTTDRLDALCQACAAAVDQTRQRFARGVRQVIAVTPFLSKNLVHDYDHLQAGYAYLLESALISYPGVAVVETEEARAIRRELEVAGQGLADRMVPLSVEGEYEMTVEAPGAEPAVRLSLRVSDAKRVRMERQKEGLPLPEVPELLRGSLARQIVELSQEASEGALTRKQQYAILTDRAETLSRFGAYEHSTGLREAALLLEPDDVDQRLAAIGDYLRWRQIAVRANSMLRVDREDYEEQRRRMHRQDIERLSILGGHFEHLLRRRALNPREADWLAFSIITTTSALSSSPDSGYRRQLGKVRDELFWRTCPLFPGLDPGPADGMIRASVARSVGFITVGEADDRFSPLRQYMQWTDRAANFLLFRTRDSDGQRALDNLFRFLTQIASPKIPLPFMVRTIVGTRSYNLSTQISQGRLQADQVREFFERLRQTQEPLNVFYARLGLLWLEVTLPGDEDLDREAVQEVDALLQFVRDLDANQPDYRRIVVVYEHELNQLRSEILKKLGEVSQEKLHRPPQNPIAEKGATLQVNLELVEGIRPDWIGLRKCTDSLDMAWTPSVVYAIPEKGVVNSVFSASQAMSGRPGNRLMYSPVWDGRNFWTACEESGIYLVSREGEVLGHVGAEQGLPPAAGARGLALHPVAPGQCVAVGHFGPHQRAWCALVSQQDRPSAAPSFSVNVFHRATKSPRTAAPPHDDPDLAFAPGWMTEYVPSQTAEKRLLLVNRWIRGTGSRPLAIDLDSLAVSVFPVDFRPSRGYLCVDGRIVAPFVGPELYTPSGETPEGWVRTSLVHYEPMERKPHMQFVILAHEGMLYQPGTEWLAIDPRTWEVQRLRSAAVPYQDPFEYYALSAHYGLVAWNEEDRMFRISIEPRPPSDADLSTRYPYVPPALRARHDEAVQAIRRLGGSVDTRWGFCRHTPRVSRCGNGLYVTPREPKTFRWRTIVYLPEAWKGADAGLAHLEHLYNLCDLYLVQADVTNDGLKLIGELAGLESLYLIETKATNEGLIHLQGLDALVYLRLEGTADSEQFGDGGLKHVRDLPRLAKLALYGKAFTDQGLVHLESLPRLHELWMLKTAITKTGLARLEEQKPGLVCQVPSDYWARFPLGTAAID